MSVNGKIPKPTVQVGGGGLTMGIEIPADEQKAWSIGMAIDNWSKRNGE